jgi:hypothetical protein
MEFEGRCAVNFESWKGQGACPARMALGALFIKGWHDFSDEDVVAEIAMNPYLQYFLEFLLPEIRICCGCGSDVVIPSLFKLFVPNIAISLAHTGRE